MTKRRHALIDPNVWSAVTLRKKHVSLSQAVEFVDVHIHNVGPNTLEFRIDLSPGRDGLDSNGLTDYEALYVWEEKTAPTTLAAGVEVNVNIPETWAQALQLWINDQSVQGDGTATLVGVLAGDVLTVNGLDYTAVAGTKANNTEFSIDGTDSIDALDLADSINHDTRTGITVPGLDVSAETAAGVVTITCTEAGVAGNSIDLVGVAVRMVVSGALLTGGTDVDAPTRYHAYINFIS